MLFWDLCFCWGKPCFSIASCILFPSTTLAPPSPPLWRACPPWCPSCPRSSGSETAVVVVSDLYGKNRDILQTYLALSSQYAILVRSCKEKKSEPVILKCSSDSKRFHPLLPCLKCQFLPYGSMDRQKVEPLRRRLVFLEQVELFISDAFNPDISSWIMEGISPDRPILQRLVISHWVSHSAWVFAKSCFKLALHFFSSLSANLYFISWVRLRNQVAC